MVSVPNLFRKRPLVGITDFDMDDIDDSSETLINSYTHSNVSTQSLDPTRRVRFVRIAFVSVDESSKDLALLPDEVFHSALVQRVILPRNPRVAGEELYELDGMDLIVVVPEERRITKDVMRWLKLLKQLDVPMLVLLPFGAQKRGEQEKINQFSQYVGLPVVTMAPDDLDTARQEFVMTTMTIAPATGLALAAKMPDFRSPLMRNLMDRAADISLHVNAEEQVIDVQHQLVRQICAAHDCNGREFETDKAALETLAKVTAYYTHALVNRFPMKDKVRRLRFAHAVSTLLIGYAAAIHLGATPPAIRSELLPQVWRLYRASKQPVQE